MYKPILGQMKKQINALMYDSIELLTATETFDAYGKAAKSYTVSQNASGLFATFDGTDREILESTVDKGIEYKETARLLLPADVTPAIGSFLRETGSSKVWRVAHVSSEETFGIANIVLLTR